MLPLDLHVLGTPPALILSQDQTLKLSSLESHFIGSSDISFMSSKWFIWQQLLRVAHQIPPLILDGLCACTFYLVFKEPTLAATGIAFRCLARR